MIKKNISDVSFCIRAHYTRLDSRFATEHFDNERQLFAFLKRRQHESYSFRLPGANTGHCIQQMLLSSVNTRREHYPQFTNDQLEGNLFIFLSFLWLLSLLNQNLFITGFLNNLMFNLISSNITAVDNRKSGTIHLQYIINKLRSSDSRTQAVFPKSGASTFGVPWKPSLFPVSYSETSGTRITAVNLAISRWGRGR